jgi:acylphosphatase
MAVERARVIFAGFVQGVGFRFTTKMLAGGYAVTGWVRNLADGTVEVEAQGEKDEVRAFIDRIRSEMKRNIVETTLTWTGARMDEQGFSVRF